MERSSDPLTEDKIWGTCEELLLACAVNRHGTHSWDAVATEVRSRSPCADLLTADTCRQHYRLLKNRFSGGGVDGINGGDEITEGGPTVEIPWLDELRKLRVAELRREVQRYDVSIWSLQLKVKTLKEERERSLRERQPDDAGDGVNGSGSGSDPKEKNHQQKDRPESPRSTPDKIPGDRISGVISGRSCKESNSTELKVEEGKVEERIKEEADPAVNGYGSRYGPVQGAAESFNGSSDTIAKGAARSPAAEPNPTVNEWGESVAESKGDEEEGTKESSDVQSSASLSRLYRRGRRLRGTTSAAEPEAEAVSTDSKAVDAESQPLIAFFETIRSNTDRSVFDPRLKSQEESVLYRNLIRRHVDLEMVRNRMGRNGYTRAEFFRDLLLLCNNALVFYPKNSPESISAVNLRDLINKEIAAILRKPPQTSPRSAKEPTPPASAPPAEQSLPPLPSKPKSDPDRATTETPAPLSPLVACRKRSSILSKPAKHGKKIEKVEKERKKIEEEEVEEEKKQVPDKKSMKQRSVVSRGMRTNKARGNRKGGGGGGGGAVKNSNPVCTSKPDPAEQETKTGVSTAKKRSAADFLNRMKSSSPLSKGRLVEKSSSSSRRGGGEHPKKKAREESAAAAASVKRSVGRPPKRAVEIPAPQAKRAREEKTPPLPKKRRKR